MKQSRDRVWIPILTVCGQACKLARSDPFTGWINTLNQMKWLAAQRFHMARGRVCLASAWPTKMVWTGWMDYCTRPSNVFGREFLSANHVDGLCEQACLAFVPTSLSGWAAPSIRRMVGRTKGSASGLNTCTCAIVYNGRVLASGFDTMCNRIMGKGLGSQTRPNKPIIPTYAHSSEVECKPYASNIYNLFPFRILSHNQSYLS